MQKCKLLSEAFNESQSLKKAKEFDKLIDNKDFIPKLENIIFEVDNVAWQITTIFENCKFVFSKNSKVRFNKCTFKNCELIGIDDYKNYLRTPNDCGELLLDGCNANNLKLCKNFKAVRLSGLECEDIIDESIVRLIDIRNSTFINPKIFGDCRILNIDSSIFLKSSSGKGSWDKKINLSAKCRYATFEQINLNPYYLSVKCEDKSSLDISGAIFTDDWSMLRKKYSGLSLFLVLLFTIIFFLPFFFKIFGLTITAKLINQTAINIEKIPLWQILFFGGEEGFLKLSYCITTIILVLYNVIRLFLTISLAKLREEELFLSDAGFPTVSPNPNKYGLHKKIDYYLNIVFLITLLISGYKIFEAFTVSVPAFKIVF